MWRSAGFVKDKTGAKYLAGSVPASDSTMMLPAGQRAKLQQDTALKFSRAGRPIEIDSMTAYVSQVEFADGHDVGTFARIWIRRRCCGSRRRRRKSSGWRTFTRRRPGGVVAELNRY